MIESTCGSLGVKKRPVTRRASRALSLSLSLSEAASANDASAFCSLPDDLILRVVSILLQPPKVTDTAFLEQQQCTRRAKDVVSLVCVSRRFACLRAAVDSVARDAVHHLWHGAELSRLPVGCLSWHNLLALLETCNVAVSFRWRIDSWKTFQADAATRSLGATFSAAGFSWRLLLFPRGNTVPFLSLYLAVTSDFRQRLPAHWSKSVRFALAVPNHAAAPALVKVTQHNFDSREDDWGFTQLLELAELEDSAKGWLSPDGALVLEALILPSFSPWLVRNAATAPPPHLTRTAQPHPPTLSWTGEAFTQVE